jgi:hypothetical protein
MGGRMVLIRNNVMCFWWVEKKIDEGKERGVEGEEEKVEGRRGMVCKKLRGW